MWWIVAFVLSAALCTYAIRNIWMKWQMRPVIVSFDDKSTPISTIPFPALTICSTNKFIKEKIDTELFDKIILEMGSNASAYKGHAPEMYKQVSHSSAC